MSRTHLRMPNLLIWGLLASVSLPAFADRDLGQEEVLSILRDLTAQPRQAWISTGSIEATHSKYLAPRMTDTGDLNARIRERIAGYQNGENRPEVTQELRKMRLDAIPFNIRYRYANEQLAQSTIVVRCDGEKRYTEINVDSHSDSVRPGPELAGNIKTRQFNMDWNATRIFAFDGLKHTTYLLPVNNAIVDETRTNSGSSNGTLTAGLIPWGYGLYTYDSLVSCNPTAVEKYVNGRTEIHLTIETSTGTQVIPALDPQRDYALFSCTIAAPDGSQTIQQYSDYELVAGNWIPKTIMIERYEAASGRMLSSDLWNFKKVSAEQPSDDDFNVILADDAIVQYRSNLTGRPLTYRYSESVDNESLLSEKLAFEASRTVQAQNCATAAMKLAAKRLGKDIPDNILALLVGETDGQTSLYQMKEMARGLNLHCCALETDIETLKNLQGCQAILHIPGKRHFVALDHIDEQYVWLVDLAGGRFYYRIPIDFFDMDWPDGTALLLSNSPLWFSEPTAELTDLELIQIKGNSGYTCTRVIQMCDEILCDLGCFGFWEWYTSLVGCEPAETGSCQYTYLYGGVEAPCVTDMYDHRKCRILEDHTVYYFMQACDYGECGLW